jgi:hypothetical protein
MKEKYNLKGTYYSFTPSIRITTDINKFNIFAKAGLIIARCSFKEENEFRSYTTFPNYWPMGSYTTTIQYKLKWELGAFGMAGLEYQLFSLGFVNLGVQFNAISYKPSSASRVK